MSANEWLKADEAKKAEPSQEAEQRKLDRQAYRDSLHGRRIPSVIEGVESSRYDEEFDALRKKHPTLCSLELHEMWEYNTFGVPVDLSEKKSTLNEKHIVRWIWTETEQRKSDREALQNALLGRRIRGGEKRVSSSRYSDEIKALRKKHPTLFPQEAYEMWYHNTFSVPIEGFVKKEQVSPLHEKQAESKEGGLSTQQVDEKLQLLRNELTSLKTAKREIEEQKQAEINTLKQELEKLTKKHKKTTQQDDERVLLMRDLLSSLATAKKEVEEQKRAENDALKEELETLKKEHEKTFAKLKVAEDIAQRDHNLEQKLVSLAEAMLVSKRGNEKSFKDLKRRVKKSGGASESEHLKEKLLKTQEELEARNMLIEELQKAEPSKPMKMVDEPETKYVKAEELQRSRDEEEEVKLLEKAARENLTKLLFKEMFGEDFELEINVLKEQDKIQKVLAGEASESDHLKEELEARNVLIEELQNSLRKKEVELAQKSDKEEQLMAKKKELEQHIQIVKSTTLMLNEQTENLKKVKAELLKTKTDVENTRMRDEPEDDMLPLPSIAFFLIMCLLITFSIIFAVVHYSI